MRIVSRRRARRTFAALLALLNFLTLFPGRAALAQVAPALKSEDTLPRKQARQPFRIETLPVGQGAELLTVFGSLDGLNAAGAQDKDVPLVSVLRDTLGDNDSENDCLRYVADAGARASTAAASAAAKIFARTEDAETRRLCLDCLYRINDEAAKRALLEIYRSPELDPDLRETTAQYLRDALRQDQRIAPADAKAIINVVGQ
jgi:hypothetical protein